MEQGTSQGTSPEEMNRPIGTASEGITPPIGEQQDKQRVQQSKVLSERKTAAQKGLQKSRRLLYALLAMGSLLLVLGVGAVLARVSLTNTVLLPIYGATLLAASTTYVSRVKRNCAILTLRSTCNDLRYRSVRVEQKSSSG